MKGTYSLFCLWGSWMVATSCARGAPRQPDLAEQPDRWVGSVALDSSSHVEYIGKTKDYLITSTTSIKQVAGVTMVSVGDVIEGLRIGAIRCSFFWRDASYGGKQYMWRGQWGCQAGRTKEEVEHAVAENGDKRFDYLHLGPVHENQLGPVP